MVPVTRGAVVTGQCHGEGPGAAAGRAQSNHFGAEAGCYDISEADMEGILRKKGKGQGQGQEE
eukprot:748138-Hanusia_phi.AAC.1